MNLERTALQIQRIHTRTTKTFQAAKKQQHQTHIEKKHMGQHCSRTSDCEDLPPPSAPPSPAHIHTKSNSYKVLPTGVGGVADLGTSDVIGVIGSRNLVPLSSSSDMGGSVPVPAKYTCNGDPRREDDGSGSVTSSSILDADGLGISIGDDIRGASGSIRRRRRHLATGYVPNGSASTAGRSSSVASAKGSVVYSSIVDKVTPSQLLRMSVTEAEERSTFSRNRRNVRAGPVLPSHYFQPQRTSTFSTVSTSPPDKQVTTPKGSYDVNRAVEDSPATKLLFDLPAMPDLGADDVLPSFHRTDTSTSSFAPPQEDAQEVGGRSLKLLTDNPATLPPEVSESRSPKDLLDNTGNKNASFTDLDGGLDSTSNPAVLVAVATPLSTEGKHRSLRGFVDISDLGASSRGADRMLHSIQTFQTGSSDGSDVGDDELLLNGSFVNTDMRAISGLREALMERDRIEAAAEAAACGGAGGGAAVDKRMRSRARSRARSIRQALSTFAIPEKPHVARADVLSDSAMRSSHNNGMMSSNDCLEFRPTAASGGIPTPCTRSQRNSLSLYEAVTSQECHPLGVVSAIGSHHNLHTAILSAPLTPTKHV